jgi:cysteinyl-tRNA synthetase
MGTSYRKPLNFTWESLEVAKNTFNKIRTFGAKSGVGGSIIEKYKSAFLEALCDDLNTAKALSVVFEILNDKISSKKDLWATLVDFDNVLGLNLKEIPVFTVTSEAHELIIKRDKARAEKDFNTSDKFRVELEALGYEVSDTPEGTVLS